MALDTTKPEDGVQVADLPRYIRETREAIITTGVMGVAFESGVQTGDAVYLDSTNNVWRRSLAGDPTRGKFHGFADVDQGLIVIWGFFTNEEWVFTDGATVYVADDDLGALTATDTGLVAGICVAGDTILLDSQISASFGELRAEVIAARDGSADLHTKLEAMDAARAAVASEVATARGASATLAGRLSLIDSGVSGVADEVGSARGDAATLGQRLDVSINPDGSLKTTTSVSNFAEETAAILYVSSSTFTVAGDKTAVYVTNRTIRCNSSAALIGYVSSSSYATGTGLTTVIVTGVTVPVSLTSIEYSFHPNEMPRMAHSGLSSILAADPSSSDVTANKHVSNNQLKVLTDGKQPLDATLTALAGLATSANKIVLATGADAFSMIPFNSPAQNIGAAADVAAVRGVLGLGDAAVKNVGAGSGNVAAGDHNHSGVYQPVDAELTAIAGLTSAANKVPYFTGSGTAALASLTSFARTLLDDADAATARTTLGADIWRTGGLISIYTTQTLSASHLGKHLNTYSSPTLTLPPAAGCENGSIILVSCYSGTTTIVRNGTDVIYITTSPVSSFTLSAGEFAIISSAGALWVAVISSPNAAVDLSVFNSLLSQLSAARASGAVPNGWCWLFKTDELATKTGASYDSIGKYYANAGAITVAASESSSTGTFTWYTDADDLWDGDTEQVFYTAASGAAVVIHFASPKALNKWTVTHRDTGAFYITWTGAGSHVYWRLRWTADMANSTSASCSWIIEYSDNGSSWTAASTTKSYTANSVVISMAVEAQGNMTLIPNAITVSEHPTTATVYMLHQAIDAVTYGTDLKARVSTDNGSNWSGYGTLEKVCDYDTDYSLLKASIDVSALTGTSFVWEITTLNTKSQRVRAVAALFS